VTYGGDSGNRIFVLYWKCSLIRVSVIRGSTIFGSKTKQTVRLSVCLYVRQHQNNSLSSGRIFMKFDCRISKKSLRENEIFIKIR
jgi:Holliday junction resolvase RusA-like endonuclease